MPKTVLRAPIVLVASGLHLDVYSQDAMGR